MDNYQSYLEFLQTYNLPTEIEEMTLTHWHVFYVNILPIQGSLALHFHIPNRLVYRWKRFHGDLLKESLCLACSVTVGTTNEKIEYKADEREELVCGENLAPIVRFFANPLNYCFKCQTPLFSVEKKSYHTISLQHQKEKKVQVKKLVQTKIQFLSGNSLVNSSTEGL